MPGPAPLLAPLLALLLSLLAAAVPSPAAAAVWRATAAWDEAAEQRYSQWVERRFHADFFYRDSPYAGIATDCADAAYGMRIAFAFEQSLPFRIRRPDGPGFITQETGRFDHLPEGLPRLRAFMDWVMVQTGTGTLANDTYPVRIDREQIRPGIIYLGWRTHAMQIVALEPTGVVRYLASTAPRAVRPMRAILGFPPMVPADPRAGGHGDGFRRFRQPQDYGRPEHLLPGYGLEQFEQARHLQRETLAYYEWMQSRLAIAPEPVAQLARRTMFALCAITYDRANAVDEAQALLAELRRSGRRRMTAAEIDDHSTPTRDRLLLRAFEHLQEIAARPDWPAVSGRYRTFVDLLTGRLAPEHVGWVRESLLGWCDVGRLDGGPGRPMDLLEVRTRLQAGRMSADPQASRAERWGIAGESRP